MTTDVTVQPATPLSAVADGQNRRSGQTMAAQAQAHVDAVARAREIVATLTVEEKASLTSGLDFWHTKGIESAGIPSIMVTDGPHGLRKQTGETDHLGLNASVPTTCFPTAAALGSTWDLALLERVGVALGEEVVANDVAVVLGPGTNIKRSPLCGRNFEYFSEDPYLSGKASTALIAGVQSQGVGTSLKHYAANNQETDRMRVDAQVDERTLREIYLAPFEIAVAEAQPWTIMCSYNRLNGIYASQHPWLLTEVLRNQWDFAGLVVSDWGAVDERVPALEAGLDLEMPASGGDTDRQIVEAVRAGTLDEKVLDQAAIRLVALVLKSRLIYEAGAVATTFDAAAHHDLARQAAAAGSVLLRNEQCGEASALPLAAAEFSAETPLVIVGEFARTPRYQGAGSSQINPTQIDSALDALNVSLGEDAVVFLPGFHLAEASAAQEADGSATRTAEELRAEAVAAAAGKTTVIFAGLPAVDESEGYDREHMMLPAEQIALIEAVAESAGKIIVVLSNGSAVAVEPWINRTHATLECWLGGQASGSAVVDMLLGILEPSGRLAESIPEKLSDHPAQLNFPGEAGVVRYGEGIFVGYRGIEATGHETAYPFGYGLSYTSFDIAMKNSEERELSIASSDNFDSVASVEVTVTNTGKRAGAEVVQLYVTRDSDSAVARAPRHLADFIKVYLQPGESQTVTLHISTRSLSHWDAVAGEWKIEEGDWTARVVTATSSNHGELHLAVSNTDAPASLREDASMAEWWNDAKGRELLEQHAPAIGHMMADPSVGGLLGGVPLERLSRMPGLGVTPEEYKQLWALYNA